jgi:hypothetical protein
MSVVQSRQRKPGSRRAVANSPANQFMPWSWQPSSSAWHDNLVGLAARWEPSPELGLDGTTIRRVVEENAAKHAHWLVHPCLNAMTSLTLEAKPQRDFQLAVWIAINTHEPLGGATLDSPVWAWSPSGGLRLEPGTYDLATVAATLRKQPNHSPITVDQWGQATNVPLHHLWGGARTIKADEQKELLLLTQALTVAQQHLPECFAWAHSRTQVVIPLRGLSGEDANNSSTSSDLPGVVVHNSETYPDLPGVVFLTLHSELQIIEALVHESAHLHLFMAERSGALVDPRHTACYKSPLRADPRPLRGILLAGHALAYIAAYYTDALHASIAPRAPLEAMIARTRQRMDAALDILLANRQYITAHGSDFVDATTEVAQYSA